MDYKEKYENGVECIQEILSGAADLIRISTLRKRLQPFFPELKEKKSEDEQMIERLKSCVYASDITSEGKEEIFAWLEKHGKQNPVEWSEEDEKIKESIKKHIFNADDWYVSKVDGKIHNVKFIEKQGEEKPTDEVKPKFKVGDWITNGHLTCKVLSVTGKSYELHLYNDDYCHFETDVQSVDKYYHLWTIQDAKEGDVLATENFIFIFKNIDDSNGVHYYCHYEISKREDDGSRFGIALPQSLMGIVGSSFTHYKPATKEQRDMLFQKMKEEGYEWDDKKKAVKRIEPEFDGDDILLSLSLGNNQVQDILEDMGMLDDNGQCPHTAEEIFKAGMEHAFNLNREAASSVKIK